MQRDARFRCSQILAATESRKRSSVHPLNRSGRLADLLGPQPFKTPVQLQRMAYDSRNGYCNQFWGELRHAYRICQSIENRTKFRHADGRPHGGRGGARYIFADKQSGATWDRRELQAAQSHLRQGDTLVVWKLDRLGRTVLQSVQFLAELHKAGVEFRSLTEGIDTNTPMGKFYFVLASALAELERDRLIERTNAGLKAARARGRTGGRKRALEADREAHALELLADGKRSQADVARLMGVSRPTITRIVQRASGSTVLAEAAD